MSRKNKHAAIEMSMTTIVTIVLVVVTLVLALVLIRTIFTSSTNAVEQVDTAIQDQINSLFASEGKNLEIYPASREINIKRGDIPKGFVFSVENPNNTDTMFSYTVTASDVTNCGSSLTQEMANSYVLGGTGSFSLGPSAKLDLARLVKFSIPDSSPKCTVIYNLAIPELSTGGADIFVTIQ
ncbi:MAG TPA: hypothetical protein VMC07_00985 [Candidatus Omnitrophota bacterium]|nr:hypothetical protein [Candidatus Omnitrophota bacterium]